MRIITFNPARIDVPLSYGVKSFSRNIPFVKGPSRKRYSQAKQQSGYKSVEIITKHVDDFKAHTTIIIIDVKPSVDFKGQGMIPR